MEVGSGTHVEGGHNMSSELLGLLSCQTGGGGGQLALKLLSMALIPLEPVKLQTAPLGEWKEFEPENCYNLYLKSSAKPLLKDALAVRAYN